MPTFHISLHCYIPLLPVLSSQCKKEKIKKTRKGEQAEKSLWEAHTSQRVVPCCTAPARLWQEVDALNSTTPGQQQYSCREGPPAPAPTPDKPAASSCQIDGASQLQSQVSKNEWQVHYTDTPLSSWVSATWSIISVNWVFKHRNSWGTHNCWVCDYSEPREFFLLPCESTPEFKNTSSSTALLPPTTSSYAVTCHYRGMSPALGI